MNTKRSRRKQRQTQKRKMKGGRIDCEAEGFNQSIREATLGREYPGAVVDHDRGETWSYEDLVDISTRGMVGWYCKQAGLTKEEASTVLSMSEVQSLGAFFHRYKVFSEQIGIGKRYLRNVTSEELDTLTTKFSKRSDATAVLVNKAIPIIQNYRTTNYQDFLTADFPIEQAIDRTQCLLWYIVKNKKLPEGFTMDERIETRAKTPIQLSYNEGWSFSASLHPFPLHKVLALYNLIELVNKDNKELSEPPVTFGVF